MSYTGLKRASEATEGEELDGFAEGFVRMLYGAGFTEWQPRSAIYESLQQVVGPAPYLRRFDPLIQKLLDEGAMVSKEKDSEDVVRLHRKAADYLDPIHWDYVVADIRRNGYGGPLWETVTAVLPRARRPARGIWDIWGIFESILLAFSAPVKAFIVSAPVSALLLRPMIPAAEYPGWLTTSLPEPWRPTDILSSLGEFALQCLLLVWAVCAVWFFLYHWLVPDHEKDRCIEVHMPFWWHVKVPGVGLLVWTVAPAGVWISSGVFLIGSMITIAAIEARRY